MEPGPRPQQGSKFGSLTLGYMEVPAAFLCFSSQYVGLMQLFYFSILLLFLLFYTHEINIIIITFKIFLLLITKFGIKIFTVTYREFQRLLPI